MSAILSWLPMLLNCVELGITFLADQEITFPFPKFCVYSRELLPCLTEFITELEMTYVLCSPDEIYRVLDSVILSMK